MPDPDTGGCQLLLSLSLSLSLTSLSPFSAERRSSMSGGGLGSGETVRNSSVMGVTAPLGVLVGLPLAGLYLW